MHGQGKLYSAANWTNLWHVWRVVDAFDIIDVIIVKISGHRFRIMRARQVWPKHIFVIRMVLFERCNQPLLDTIQVDILIHRQTATFSENRLGYHFWRPLLWTFLWPESFSARLITLVDSRFGDSLC